MSQKNVIYNIFMSADFDTLNFIDIFEAIFHDKTV